MYRSTSCNDLILKNAKEKQGYLNKKEFSLGILLGFWDRQVGKTHFLKDNQRNDKNSRWSPNGKIDLFCEKMKKYEY
jgi:hypothetical protein